MLFFIGLLITTSCPSGLHQILILIFKLFNIYQRLFLNFHIFHRHRPSSPHVYFYCDAVTGLCRYMVGSTNIDRGGLTAVWKHCCLNKRRLKTLPSVTGFSTFYVSTNNARFTLKLAIFVERKVGREFYILMIQVAQIKTQAFMYFLCLLRWIQRQGGLEKYGSGGGCRNRDRGGWVRRPALCHGGRPLTLLLLLLLLLLSPFVQLLPPPLSTWASAAATRYMLHDTDYMSHAAYMLNAFFCLLIYPQ